MFPYFTTIFICFLQDIEAELMKLNAELDPDAKASSIVCSFHQTSATEHVGGWIYTCDSSSRKFRGWAVDRVTIEMIYL